MSAIMSKHPELDSLRAVGFDMAQLTSGDLPSYSPINGSMLGRVATTSAADYEQAVAATLTAFVQWKAVPAPRRGELVRQFGALVRTHKSALAHLIVLEVGKIPSEAAGEVQEVIDICDFAVGLSRQLHGLTIASERVRHHMLERWHPLGPVAIITAFNFPMAVWSWNAALALICGNPVIWKPSEKTPLTALALAAILESVVRDFNDAPIGLSALLIGERSVGEWLSRDKRIALVSATGSTRMGRDVASQVAARFGKTLLELGGNNAMIVAPSAREDLAVRAITFAAAGTAGQRCTTLRRLYVHESRYSVLLERLLTAFASLPVGNPLEKDVLIGPLIDQAAYDAMQSALVSARTAGGVVHGGERVNVPGNESGFYVRPALVELQAAIGVSQAETFAPILYVFSYRTIEEAISANNAVTQGLSSSLMTQDLSEAELFLSAEGSDCGIANINIGPSGAEIGGAFGGEKETGGGRESGSDAWKAYMRRQTQTVNYSAVLPLAQGVKFDVG
jgi:aldehyde dehydrogenase (NAD+)